MMKTFLSSILVGVCVSLDVLAMLAVFAGLAVGVLGFIAGHIVVPVQMIILSLILWNMKVVTVYGK